MADRSLNKNVTRFTQVEDKAMIMEAKHRSKDNDHRPSEQQWIDSYTEIAKRKHGKKFKDMKKEMEWLARFTAIQNAGLALVRCSEDIKLALPLGRERRVYASVFKDKLYTHVRCFFKPKDGNDDQLWIPTKKGIALTQTQWDELIFKACYVTETLQRLSSNTLQDGPKLKAALGESVYLTVTVFKSKIYVHIRKFDVKRRGLETPTKTGITLSPEEWTELQDKTQQIHMLQMGEAAKLSPDEYTRWQNRIKERKESHKRAKCDEAGSSCLIVD